MDIPRGLKFVVTLNGVDHEVDYDAITARQVGELELYFAASPERLVARLLAQQVSPYEAAAVVYLAGRQAGAAPDPDELLDRVRIGDDCTVKFVGDVLPSIDRGADPNS